jgi:hypothetical protein
MKLVATTRRKDSSLLPLEKGERLMSNKILAVNVLLALGVCVFSMSLAVLVAPALSSEAVVEWLTTTPPCGSTDSAGLSSLFT